MRTWFGGMPAVIGAVFAALVFAGIDSRAQGANRVAKEDESALRDITKSLRIKKVDWRGSGFYVRAPEYEFRNVPRTSIRPPQQWGVITVSYDTSPDWLDQITVSYHVLLKVREKEKKDSPEYVLLEGLVEYVDVKKGNNHVSTMYIRPTTLDRIGDPVAVGVEITAGDETVTMVETTPASNLRGGGAWWNAIRNSDKVAARSGLLLNRSQTPFVLANYNDEEMIRL